MSEGIKSVVYSASDLAVDSDVQDVGGRRQIAAVKGRGRNLIGLLQDA